MLKRLMGALCLLLICSSAAASVSLRTQYGATLLSADGEIIVEEGIHSDIVSIGNGLFAAGDSKAYALMNAQGEILSEKTYTYMKCESDVIIAEKGGALGLLNLEGREISEFKYTDIVADTSGVCRALYGNADSALGMRLYILKDCEKIETELQLARIGDTSYRGLLSFKDTNGRYGYVSLMGETLIAAQYRYASDFVNGYAAVVIEDQYGAIDTSGAFIVAPEYDYLEISEYGYIVAAQANARVAIFDYQGELLSEYFGDNIKIALVGRYYTVCDDISLRIYDDTHEMSAEVSPSTSVYVGLGDQLILSDGAFGEYNTRIWKTQNLYQHIYPLGNISGESVYAAMIVNAVKYENHILKETQYSLDMDSVRYVLIDSDGEKLTDEQYLSVALLGEDRLLVQTEEAYRMIDIYGETYWSRTIETAATAE